MINKTTKPIGYTSQSWKKFRESGLLWAINNFLHMFGWSIIYEFDDDNQVVNVYPARVDYLAFDYKLQVKGQRQLRQYMSDEGPGLLVQANKDDEPGV